MEGPPPLEPPRGCEHDHATAIEGPLPHQGTDLPAQDQGSAAGAQDRTHLFQGRDPRALYEPDLFRRRNLRHRSGLEKILRKIGRRARAPSDGAPRRTEQESRRLQSLHASRAGAAAEKRRPRRHARIRGHRRSGARYAQGQGARRRAAGIGKGRFRLLLHRVHPAEARGQVRVGGDLQGGLHRLHDPRSKPAARRGGQPRDLCRADRGRGEIRIHARRLPRLPGGGCRGRTGISPERGDRPRSEERPHQGAGWRQELRRERVQPRDTVPETARLGLQALYLCRRPRERIRAERYTPRHAPRGRAPARGGLQAAQFLGDVPRRRVAPLRPQRIDQRAGDQTAAEDRGAEHHRRRAPHGHQEYAPALSLARPRRAGGHAAGADELIRGARDGGRPLGADRDTEDRRS